MRHRFALAVLATVVLPPALRAQAPALAWGPAPAVFAPGAKMAVLQGDPSKSALYTVRLDMPDGYRIAPHWHPIDELVTVISGTFVVGLGDSVNTAREMTLAAGAYVIATANMHHYAIARGHTIVQVHGMGPFALTYVNLKDAPPTAPHTR